MKKNEFDSFIESLKIRLLDIYKIFIPLYPNCKLFTELKYIEISNDKIKSDYLTIPINYLFKTDEELRSIVNNELIEYEEYTKCQQQELEYERQLNRKDLWTNTGVILRKEFNFSEDILQNRIYEFDKII